MRFVADISCGLICVCHIAVESVDLGGDCIIRGILACPLAPYVLNRLTEDVALMELNYLVSAVLVYFMIDFFAYFLGLGKDFCFTPIVFPQLLNVAAVLNVKCVSSVHLIDHVLCCYSFCIGINFKTRIVSPACLLSLYSDNLASQSP